MFESTNITKSLYYSSHLPKSVWYTYFQSLSHMVRQQLHKQKLQHHFSAHISTIFFRFLNPNRQMVSGGEQRWTWVRERGRGDGGVVVGDVSDVVVGEGWWWIVKSGRSVWSTPIQVGATSTTTTYCISVFAKETRRWLVSFIFRLWSF